MIKAYKRIKDDCGASYIHFSSRILTLVLIIYVNGWIESLRYLQLFWLKLELFDAYFLRKQSVLSKILFFTFCEIVQGIFFRGWIVSRTLPTLYIYI